MQIILYLVFIIRIYNCVFCSQALLHEHCGLFFVPLSLAMLNDDSATCKKMVALAIKSLLSQLDLQRQNSMFNLVNTWLTGEKVSRKTTS